jgi:ribonucleoside-triphosphate reductase
MSADRFGEADKPDSITPEDSEAGEPEVLVRRSDEDMALFDSQQIVDALVREASVDRDLAQLISSQVRQFIQKFGVRTLSSSLIRGLVDAKLLELGLEDAHRAHARLGVPFYDVDRLMHSTFRHPPAHPCGPEGTSLMLAEAIKREYSILGVFSDQIANAHLVGDIHIHRIGAIDRPHSVTASVDYVKKFGVVLPHGFASARPARHADVLVAHLVKLSAALQGYVSGPVVWDSLNYSLAPFLRGLDARGVRQLAQTLVFELSAPAVARGGQVVQVDLHLDWDPPPYLRDRAATGPGGEPTGQDYASYTMEARQLLLALFEVYIAGDARGRPFFTPRIALHVNRDFGSSPGAQALLTLMSRIAAERGGLSLLFDRADESAFQQRYGIGRRNTFHDSETCEWRSCQFQTITLNLPRVGYLAGQDQVKVFEELTRLMETAAQAHLEKRVFLEKLLALGEKGPLSVLTTRAGGSGFLKLSWTTQSIGIVGLNEMCLAVLGSELHESAESREFARKVLAHLKNEAERLSRKHKAWFLLAGGPADEAAVRLARLDLRFFGQTAAEVVRGDPDGGGWYYTDGARLSANCNVPIVSRIKAEGVFHELQLLNAATEVWLGQLALDAQDLSRLVSEAFYRSTSNGLVFCPEFTYCSDCGYESRGLYDNCPGCGSGRIDGMAYVGERYGYTSSFDASRLAELRDRARPAELGF